MQTGLCQHHSWLVSYRPAAQEYPVRLGTPLPSPDWGNAHPRVRRIPHPLPGSNGPLPLPSVIGVLTVGISALLECYRKFRRQFQTCVPISAILPAANRRPYELKRTPACAKAQILSSGASMGSGPVRTRLHKTRFAPDMALTIGSSKAQWASTSFGCAVVALTGRRKGGGDFHPIRELAMVLMVKNWLNWQME